MMPNLQTVSPRPETNLFLSVLSSEKATSHIWLLKFKFYFKFAVQVLKCSVIGLMATVLDTTSVSISTNTESFPGQFS